MTETHERAGFELAGRFYEFPSAFRLGDPVLVTELTGLDFNDFAERLDDPESFSNPVMLVGLIGVAVWQGNKSWTRQKVLRYVQAIDLDQFEAVVPEQEADPIPPADPAPTPATPSES